MTKRALVRAVAAGHPDLTASHVQGLVEAIFEGAADGLAVAGRQGLPGVGVLVVERHPPRPARNPRTGAAVLTGPSVTVRFTAEPAFEARVAGGFSPRAAHAVDAPDGRDPLVAFVWQATGARHARTFIAGIMVETAGAMADALRTGGRCPWPGFGSFTARARGEGHRLGFRPAAALKARLVG